MPCPNRITRASLSIPPYVGNCSGRPSNGLVSTRSTAASLPGSPAIERVWIFPRSTTSFLTCSGRSRHIERFAQFFVNERQTPVLQSIGQNHNERAKTNHHQPQCRNTKPNDHTTERSQAPLHDKRRQECQRAASHEQKPRQRQQGR